MPLSRAVLVPALALPRPAGAASMATVAAAASRGAAAAPLRVALVVGSSRAKRAGGKVARFVASRIAARGASRSLPHVYPAKPRMRCIQRKACTA